tara:strand:- start:3611 stop:4069 length:459 start_codon:yes stop_codon:yes gene_type:complete
MATAARNCGVACNILVGWSLYCLAAEKVSVRVGRAGEYLAAAVLEQFGAQVAVVRGDSFDLAAWHNSKVLRVEVKTCSRPSKYRPNNYHFTTSSGASPRRVIDRCDIVAFVALDIRRVIFMPIAQVTAKTTWINAAIFSIENEIDKFLSATR